MQTCSHLKKNLERTDEDLTFLRSLSNAVSYMVIGFLKNYSQILFNKHGKDVNFFFFFFGDISKNNFLAPLIDWSF